VVRTQTRQPQRTTPAPDGPAVAGAPVPLRARSTATAPAAPVFRTAALPTLARTEPPAPGGPQAGTPEGDLAAAREKLKSLKAANLQKLKAVKRDASPAAV
jgi:hypothetical protein